MAERGVPFFVMNHPWKANACPSSWKFRIFDLKDSSRVLSSGDELAVRDVLLRWQSTRNNGAVGERKRSIILLEDLNPRIAELLGVLLDIPPEFFLAHCSLEGELSVVNKQLSKQGNSKYWKVAVPQGRLFPRRMDPGRYQTFCGSLYRGGVTVRKPVKWNSTFNSYVSYWASHMYGVDSWTGV